MNFSGFKSGYPLALRSAASIVAFWFLLFITFSIARSLSSPFVSMLATFSDATTPALATTALQVGLGGTVVVSGAVGETGASFSLAALLLIVPIGLFYFMRALNRRYPSSAQTPVQAGAYSAAGAVLAIAGLAFLSSGENTIGAASSSLGFAWLVPAVVAAALGFSSTQGAVQASIAGRLTTAANALNGAFRGMSKLLVVLAVAGASYYALTMGTNLNPALPLWVWPLLALGFALALPTLSAILAPIFLGGLASFTSSALNDFAVPVVTDPLGALRETEQAWVSWVILGVAWLAVIVAAVRNGYRNPSNKSAWIQLTLVNIVVALLLTWLGSFRVSGSSSLLGFMQAAPSFGNEGFTTVAVFAVAGLVYGLLAHPVMKPVVTLLFEAIGVPAGKFIKVLTFVFGFRWIAPLNRLWNAISAQKFVVSKSIKYALVGSVVGISFLLGPPLTAVTAPLYDSENYADGPLVSALRTGDATNLKKLVSIDGKTFLGSDGMGDSVQIDVTDPQEVAYQEAVAKAAKDHEAAVKKAKGKKVEEVKVERPEEQNLRNISWGPKGKYYLNLQYTRSWQKAPFLTVIPQWDVAITASKLPKLTLTNGKVELRSIQVGKKAYLLSDVVILPGETEVSAGVDTNQFLVSSKAKVNLDKDAKADLKITLNTAKTKEIGEYVQSAMKKEFSGCKTLTFKISGEPKLGVVDGISGLPSLNINGSGVCVSDETGKLPYDAKISGFYSVSAAKWTFSYKF